MSVFLIFPHQLFQEISRLGDYHVYLVEEPLFFTQYRFHIQKLMLHRATMQWYKIYLTKLGIPVTYVTIAEYDNVLDGLESVSCYDVADFDLLKKLKIRFDTVITFSSPNFLNLLRGIIPEGD